jgi:acyl carrier protein
MSDRLVFTVAEVLKISPERVVEDLSPEGCQEWDSVRHFEILLAVEDAFGVRFPSHVMTNLTSVARIRQELAAMQKQ